MNAPARIKAARILRTPEDPIQQGIVQLLKFCAAPRVTRSKPSPCFGRRQLILPNLAGAKTNSAA